MGLPLSAKTSSYLTAPHQGCSAGTEPAPTEKSYAIVLGTLEIAVVDRMPLYDTHVWRICTGYRASLVNCNVVED